MVRSAGGPVRGREWAAATDRVPAVESETPGIYKTTKLIKKISVADPGFYCFNEPWIRDGKILFWDWRTSDSGISIPDHISGNKVRYKSKILKFIFGSVLWILQELTRRRIILILKNLIFC
jgi:hypothetical protein